MLRDIPKGLASTVRSIYEKSVQEHIEQKKAEAARLAELREAKKSHTVPKSPKEKSLAALAEPKDKITHADVMVGRGVKKEEVEQIDELSKTTVASYAKKASSSSHPNSASNLASRAAFKLSSGDEDDGEKEDRKSFQRSKGISKAIDRLTKEEIERLDELKKSTMASYVKKASWDAATRAADGRSEPGKGHTLKAVNRLNSIARAANKLSKNEELNLGDYTDEELESFMQSEEFEQLDELSRDTLNSYMKGRRRQISRATGAGVQMGKDTPASKKLEKNVAGYRKAWAKRDMKEAAVTPGSAFDPNYKSQVPKKPGESAGFDSKKTDKGMQFRRKLAKEETDTPGNSEHQCAIHVKHAKLGEGRTLFSQHAEPDDSGYIAWYDVMFAEGIEKMVPTSDLEILVSESHMSHKKKK